MNVDFNVTLDIGSLPTLLENCGLQDYGPVQTFIDREIINHCDRKVPFNTGILKNSAMLSSSIGEGIIVYDTPYARYLYYGEVMGPNIPIFSGGVLVDFRSPRGKAKYLTGRALTYSGAPERGAFWAERMWAEDGDDILRNAALLAGGHIE